MKKYFSIVLLIVISAVSIKYFTSDYKIEYEVNGHKVLTSYKNNRYYIEIDNKYNMDIYKRRTLKKLKVIDIEIIEEKDSFICLYPKIKGIVTYPLCYKNGEYISYDLIDSELLDKYKTKKTSTLNSAYSYNSNLEKNEIVYLWNYKGFYKMQNKDYELINLFEEGKYDNSLMYYYDNLLLFPNYEEEYVFNSLYLLNISNDKKEKIESNYEISYDGYIVGNIKNKIYLFDNKNNSLYEINTKKLSIELICDEELGYFKYENTKKVTSSKMEYRNKEVNYSNKIYSNYIYEVKDNKIYKSIKDNKELIQTLYEGENIKIVKEYNNILYFTSNDIFYKYTKKSGVTEIFNYFELNFNNNKIIYVYNK